MQAAQPMAKKAAAPGAAQRADGARTVTSRRGRYGFTVIESMVAVTVLAMGVVSVVFAVNTARSHGKVISDHSEALGLGRQLLEEIVSKPFDDPDGPSVPGPEPLEISRLQYDNADDYHGYTDSSSALKAEDGTAVGIALGRTYTRQARVEYRSGPSGPAAPTGDYALVKVSVSDDAGKTINVAQLLTRVRRQR